MKSENDGIQKIFIQPAYITEKERRNPDSPREYYIYHKWRVKDTNNQGEIILPLTEKIFVNILESISNSDFC